MFRNQYKAGAIVHGDIENYQMESDHVGKPEEEERRAWRTGLMNSVSNIGPGW